MNKKLLTLFLLTISTLLLSVGCTSQEPQAETTPDSAPTAEVEPEVESTLEAVGSRID